MNKIDAIQTVVDFLLENTGIDPAQKQSFKELINSASDTPLAASSPIEEQQDATLVQPELALTATEVVEPPPPPIAEPEAMEGALPDPVAPVEETPAPVAVEDQPAPAPVVEQPETAQNPVDIDDTDAAVFLAACGGSFDEAVQRLSIQYNKEQIRASA